MVQQVIHGIKISGFVPTNYICAVIHVGKLLKEMWKCADEIGKSNTEVMKTLLPS